MTVGASAGGRRDELAANLAAVRARIVAACAAHRRDPAGITLVAVTKTWPAADVGHLAALGVTDVGESRDQEAAAKAAECAAAGITGLRWHFVGQLQTNKVRSVLRYAVVVHSVDRARLVRTLSGAAERAGSVLDALVQVDLDEEAAGQAGGRGGVRPAAAGDLADAVAEAPGLRLRGVMAVAPLDGPPGPAFARLAEVAAEIRARHPGAGWVSAGMSADLEEAVANGATHVRVGSGLLGHRRHTR